MISSTVKLNYYDMHTHSKVLGSDGSLYPLEQVKFLYKSAFEFFKEDIRKKNIGIEREDDVKQLFKSLVVVHIGLTDHNTISGWKQLEGIDIPSNLVIHPGVEFECSEGGMLYDVTVCNVSPEFEKSEVLKYYYKNVVLKKADMEDMSADTQIAALELTTGWKYEFPEEFRYRTSLKRANDVIADWIEEEFFEPTEDELLLKIRSTPEAKKVIDYFLANGYDPKAGRQTYYKGFICNKNSPFYVSQRFGSRLSFEEVAYMVMRDDPNALVFVSHPGTYPDVPMMEFVQDKYQALKRVVERCQNEDISINNRLGFEVGHRGMSLEQTEEILNFVKEHNMIYSAESDFHKPGTNVPFHINYGKTPISTEYLSNECLNVPYDEYFHRNFMVDWISTK